MITDLYRRKIYSSLNRNRLPHYWNDYFTYEKDAPNLHSIADSELRAEIQKCKNLPRPFIDSQKLIGAVIETFTKKHNFHRQFSEKFNHLNIHREQVLGMQLYRILIEDRNDTWIYYETKSSGHAFPHATYMKT